MLRLDCRVEGEPGEFFAQRSHDPQTMLRSIAKYAVSDITIDFTEGTDIYWARQQVAERPLPQSPRGRL